MQNVFTLLADDGLEIMTRLITHMKLQSGPRVSRKLQWLP